MKPTREHALQAVRTILSFIGDDPDRPGLLETPERFLRAWEQHWGVGYLEDPLKHIKLFNDIDQKQNPMILVKDISYSSHCEHHVSGFGGKATVAYIAGKRGALGVSKVARIVTHFASKLTVQEKLTEEIADFFTTHIAPDCGVLIAGSHSCMTTRGVMQPGSSMTTSALRGAFFNDPAVRSEFLKLAE